MPKPVCVPCGRFFRPNNNGKCWAEMKPKGALAPAGKEAPERWTFYKAWRGDEWKCHGCGTTIIVGHAREPFAQDFQEGSEAKAREHGAFDVVVNDC